MNESYGAYGYICKDCQTNNTGESIDKIRDNVNTKKTAELLAKIHRIKTGHNPEVTG